MPKQVFIVYQMGKVASSSIVAALSTVRGADVHHCHFLAPASLRKAAERALDPMLSRFQYHHLSRQLLANLDCHRLIGRAGRGLERDTAVTLISLSREPLEWTRSYLVQDMPEFEPLLLRIAALNGCGRADVEDRIAYSLGRLIACVATLCDALGCVTRIAGLTHGEVRERCGIASEEEARILKRLAMLFVRPHVWFRDELEALLAAPLASFEPIGPHMYRKTRGSIRAFVLRYEDLEDNFASLADHLGLPGLPPLARDNASAAKSHAALVKAAFAASPEIGAIRRRSATDYARFFGYAAAPDGDRAARGDSPSRPGERATLVRNP